jgi:hypothetical protein
MSMSDYLHNYKIHIIAYHKFRAQNAFVSSPSIHILYRTSANAPDTSIQLQQTTLYEMCSSTALSTPAVHLLVFAFAVKS